MRTILAMVGALILVAGDGLAGPETIIRQRARELSDQNNVRQGVASPAQPAKPAAPAPVSNPAAQYPGLARLHTDLATIKLNAPVTPVQNQMITQDLLAIPTGATKPTPATAAKLASELSGALATKTLSAADRTRLVQNLNALLNPGGIQAAQKQAIIEDIQAIFQADGLPRTTAVNIANEAKTVAAEVQKGGAH